MDMVDLQNATLSGGVAVGAIADLMVYYSAQWAKTRKNSNSKCVFGLLHDYLKKAKNQCFFEISSSLALGLLQGQSTQENFKKRWF